MMRVGSASASPSSELKTTVVCEAAKSAKTKNAWNEISYILLSLDSNRHNLKYNLGHFMNTNIQ